MILVGIDIGITGAVAAIAPSGVAIHDLPTTADGERRRLCGRGLVVLLRQLVPPGERAAVVFEDVRPRPMGNAGAHGNTIHSQGSLMRSRGIVEGVLDITGWQLKVVQPQTWKRHFGLIGKDKKASAEKARELYPEAAAALKRVKDHNRCEALLIAHWGLAKVA